MRLLFIALMLLTTSGFANAQTPDPVELGLAHSTCQKHFTAHSAFGMTKGYQAGFEGCGAVEAAFQGMQSKKDADTAADKSKVDDLVKRLGK